MKAYKITLLFIDFDEVGGDGAKELIEDARLPNRIDAGTVMALEEAEIGEWTDDHPLNHGDTKVKEFKRLFPSTLTHEEALVEYERLYKDWRVKNEACNQAYAITIPELEKALAALAKAYAGSVQYGKDLQGELEDVRENRRQDQVVEARLRGALKEIRSRALDRVPGGAGALQTPFRANIATLADEALGQPE